MEETKEKIMQATIRVASARGFANTRTAEIAKEAGVSEGLIFKYYPSKSHLFAEIINLNFGKLKEGIETIIDNQSLTASEKLVNLIHFHFKFFTDEQNIAQLIFGHSDKKSLDFEVEPLVDYALRPYSQLIARILTEGIKTGEFRPLNAEVVASALIGTMQVTLVHQLFFKSKYSLEEAKNEIIAYILSGVKASNQ